MVGVGGVVVEYISVASVDGRILTRFTFSILPGLYVVACSTNRGNEHRNKFYPVVKQPYIQLRMIRASLNRGSRLEPKTSVQGKPCPSLGT